ncbi:outer membrane protein assembly factor BamB family protein [Actinoplanes sp. URMC 104]|uniref:outer membrane protein assembly factor BamB family protein n=1 Tax=Actinoplanes sp. URMC 104 TaxID=3423409 RepID=UPI003F1D63FC
MIELDLTAPADQTPSSPPPASRYRLPGLLLAAVLTLVAGGAAPISSVLWRYLGSVPSPEGAESPFQLAGGRAYTVAGSGADRVAVAWSLTGAPRKLWTARFPIRVTDPDAMSWGGLQAEPAGDVVLLTDGTDTTVVDARTGATRWTSRIYVTPLPGRRVGVVQDNEFRANTVYDQASGEPGTLYFSATGEPHTEPPLRSEVRGVDLATGRVLWTVAAAGSVNVAVPPDDPGILLLSSDRLQRIDGGTGQVVRTTPLPERNGTGPTGSELIDGTLTVYYGRGGAVSDEVVYAVDSLEQLWDRPVPEITRDPANCGGVHCSGNTQALDVLDSRTGEVRWRAPADVDLFRHGEYVGELGSDSGLPVRLVDPATGATRIDLSGWTIETAPSSRPLLLRRSAGDGASAFAVVPAGRGRIQPLGTAGGALSDCTADERHVVCRVGGELRIWAYRA